MIFTVYTFDEHNHVFLRLAVIESVGLLYKITNDVLCPMYQKNLYYMKGQGKSRLKRTDPVAIKLEKY